MKRKYPALKSSCGVIRRYKNADAVAIITDKKNLIILY